MIINHRPLQLRTHCPRHDLPVQFVCSLSSCRDRNLACSKCFNDIHKQHPLCNLDYLLTDYQSLTCNRQAQKLSLLQLLNRKHKQANNLLEQLREQANSWVDQAIRRTTAIFSSLIGNVPYLEQLSLTLGAQLVPSKIRQIIDYGQACDSLAAILDNSHLQKGRLIKCTELLVTNQPKVMRQLDAIMTTLTHTKDRVKDQLLGFQNLARKQYNLKHNFSEKQRRQEVKHNSHRPAPSKNQILRRGAELLGGFGMV